MSSPKQKKVDQQLFDAPVSKIEKNQSTAGSESLFFSSPSTHEFSSVLREVQAHISSHYAGLITDGDNGERKEQIKRYIAKYLQDNRVSVEGMSDQQLTAAL